MPPARDKLHRSTGEGGRSYPRLVDLAADSDLGRQKIASREAGSTRQRGQHVRERLS